MKKILKYKLYVTSVVPIIFMISILFARYFGGHILFHTFAEIFSVLVGLMMIIIVSYTYQFTKNNFLLYLGIGYFWVAILDLLHMLTYPGISIYPTNDPNTMLTFWLAARFLEAFILFAALFVNFHTISKFKVFVLFGLATVFIHEMAFSQYAPILYEQGSGLTSLKINLEYTIVLILMITILFYTKRKKDFDNSIYYYIIASIVLTICTELTLTFYAKVDDSFTMLAHLFKFLSYWMIFLSIVKTSLEEPFKFLAHESSTYNSIPFPSILVDSQGIIRQINDSTESFLNLEEDKIINQNNHMLFHNPNIKEDECRICQAIKNGGTLLSYHFQRNTSTYSCTVNPIRMEDVSLGSVQVCMDISQQVQLEQDKAETQERLSLILESGTDGIWDWNLLTEELYLSPRWKEQLGYRDDELENRYETWLECVHPDDKEEEAIKDYTANMEGQTDFYENIHRLRHKDGSWVWILARGHTKFDKNGKAVRMVGFHTDITQMKELEFKLKENQKALQESERKIQAWIQNSPVCTKVVDLDFNLQFMSNSGIEDLNIKDINEYYGKPYPLSFYPDSFKIPMRNNLKKAKKSGETIEQDAFVLDLDGNELWYQSTIVPVYDNKGDLDYIMVVSLDTTKRKKAEKLLHLESNKLKQSEQQLKALVSNLPGMAYRTKNDKDWSMLFLSDNCKKLTGYEADDFIQNKIITYNQVIHEDDREHVWDTIQNALKIRQSFEIEYRIIMADGTVKWVWEQGIGIFKDNELIYLDGIILDNDEGKRDEFLLIESEERFRGLFENSEVSIWNEDLTDVIKTLEELREEGVTDIRKYLTKNIKLAEEIASKVKIIDVNSATVRLFNANSKDQFLAGIDKTFGNDAILVFIDELTAIWEKEESFTKEAFFKTLDGKVMHGIVTLQIPKQLKQFSNISVSIIDITNLKKAENELKVSNDRLEQKKNELETIIQEAPNPIMLHNEDGEVLMVNKVWEELTGYDYKDIETIEKWTYHAYGERMPVIKEYIDNLYELRQKTDEGQYDIITKNGNIITWQFGSAPLGLIDGKRAIISSAMDITELKRKDEMLVNQSRHAAMGEMIGMIAHQWRQPISTIAMAANNILMDIELNTLEKQSTKVEMQAISEQTQQLSKIINDFRNFFKPDKKRSKVELEDILKETLIIVKDSLVNNNIELNILNNSQTQIEVYKRELMQVFVNIINNAKDALEGTEQKDRVIEISIYENDDYIITEICDRGCGIDKEILPKIFDPYFSTKNEKTGTGLGLYMSKVIVEDHIHGKIEAYNNKDHGACIRVKLLKNREIRDDK